MDIRDIIRASERRHLGIDWVERPRPEQSDGGRYDKDRQIANARFSHYPAAIAHCKNADAVAGLFKIFGDLEGDPPGFRIRSGGHQHEGMCSADGVLLIDLSRLQTLRLLPVEDGFEAWIPPGCALGQVYKQLWKVGWLFPGGGCPSVHTGGLIQGGGWGLWARRFGMSCDNLLEVEIVLADGRKVYASEVENADLFWAIRGGGGGNFGVVTNFRVRLHPFPPEELGAELPAFAKRFPHMTRFNAYWPKEEALDVLETWMREQARLPAEATTFCHMSVPGDVENRGRPKNLPLRIGGLYYGPPDRAEVALGTFFDGFPKTGEKVRYESFPNMGIPKAGGGDFGGDDFLTLALAELSEALQPGIVQIADGGASKPPKVACKDPMPHKVTSAFPAQDACYGKLAKQLVDHIENTDKDSSADRAVHRYVSLLGLGGAIADKEPGATAFPHRQRAFLMQLQAWWSDPKSDRSQEYVQWVTNFRKSLDGADGAFINFVDASLEGERPERGTEEFRAWKLRLLSHYYGDNLQRLMEVKGSYDPDDLFSFDMSIPLP